MDMVCITRLSLEIEIREIHIYICRVGGNYNYFVTKLYNNDWASEKGPSGHIKFVKFIVS